MTDSVLQVVVFQCVVRPHLLWEADYRAKPAIGEYLGKCVEGGPLVEVGDGERGAKSLKESERM